MSRIKVTLNPNGSTRVDLDMPDGPECDAEDAKLKAVLQLLGLGLEDITDIPDVPKQAETQPLPTKIKQGGGS